MSSTNPDPNEKRPAPRQAKSSAQRQDRPVQNQDWMDERQRARAQRRLEARLAQEKRIKQIKIGFSIAVAVILVIIIAAIVRLVSGGGSSSSNDAQNSPSAQEEVKTDDTVQSSSSGEAQGEDADSQDGGDQGEDAQGEDAQDGSGTSEDAGGSAAANVSSASSDPLSRARLLAAGYDYDGAIALLSDVEQTDEVKQEIDSWKKAKDECVAADVTKIPHVFFHSLINDDRAFTVDLVGAERVRQNNAAMTTTDEYDHMIQGMYDAGYVLVSLDDMCVKTTDESGETHVAPNTSLMLPQGKKPFVLSIDDLSYYHTYGIGTQGYATKMIVDENGKPKCIYTDANGETKTGDYDVVPRLDSFIEAHPDFAYHGARGTVAMTGYNGVFGYRTNDYYKDINDPHLDPDQIQWLQEHPDFNWEQDCKDAKAVADAMKAEGWTFASHTYGHLNAGNADVERLKTDHERWKTVNSPILGETDKIIFAFGADIGGVNGYTADNAKYQYFKNEGFNIFCNVDGHMGWTEFGDTYMRTGRVPLDGFSMYQAMTEGAVVHTLYAEDYEAFGIHDVASFFNPLRPTPIDSE